MSNWTSYQLNQIGDIITGYTPSTFNSNLWSGNIPFYSPSDFVDQVYCSSTERKISKDAIVKNRLIYPNSIMVTCIGSIGKIAMAQYKGVTNQQINTLICYEDFDPYFIFYSIKKNISKLHALYGITTIPIVNKNMFGTINLEIPDLLTQKRIAKILSTVDGQIEKTDAIIAKYQAIKQGMLHDLFTRGIDLSTGKLRPTQEQAPELYKPSPLGLIPKNWGCINLEELEIDFIDGDRGHNYPKEHEFSENGFCVFLNTKNTPNTKFNFDEVKFISEQKDLLLNNGKLKRFDIVVTTRGTIGNFVYYDNNIKYQHIRINSGMLILRLKNSQLSKFIYTMISEYGFKREYSRIASGSAQPQLPVKDFKKFKILIFDNKEEQNIIVSRLNLITQITFKEQCILHKLQKLKNSLMSKLLSYKVEK